MGEAKRRELVARQQAIEVLGLQSASGPLKVRWDDNAQATVLGQMAFFIEFLTATGTRGISSPISRCMDSEVSEKGVERGVEGVCGKAVV
jgi:hypothetical protein